MPEGKGPHPLGGDSGGWCYVKEIVMPTYAEQFAAVGCATLRFDYRFLARATRAASAPGPLGQIEDYQQLPELRCRIA